MQQINTFFCEKLKHQAIVCRNGHYAQTIFSIADPNQNKTKTPKTKLKEFKTNQQGKTLSLLPTPI